MYCMAFRISAGGQSGRPDRRHAYIVNLIVSKQVDHWVQVVVDVKATGPAGNASCGQLANPQMADQAIKTGRRQVLEPMPASERRLVHLEIA